MSKFFESDIVREELESINELQKEVYGTAMNFPTMTREQKLEHVDKLQSLVDKQ